MNGRGGPPPTLRAKALAWLAQREHSRQELRVKLQRWVQARVVVDSLAVAADPLGNAGQATEAVAPVPTAADIEAVLDVLEASRLLSDARFAESRVQARASRYGSRRVEQELQRNGVRLGDEQRHQLRATELERARQVWTRRFADAPSTPADRARQARFLAGRGFDPAVIHRVLREARDVESADASSPDTENG